MSQTLLDLFQDERYDDLYAMLDPKDPMGLVPDKQELKDMYMESSWTRETLSKVTSLRIDIKEEVEMIIGVASKFGLVDIIRILVYRSSFPPEGRYWTFDSKYTLSALEAAVVYGKLDAIDILVQAGTTNKHGGHSNLTVFEFAYMSRQLESMERLVFWSHLLNKGVCSGDAWVRVHFRMILGLPREELRIFSESADSDTPRETEKKIRVYMLEFLKCEDFQQQGGPK